METTFDYTAECGCEIVQYGTVWHGDGFVPERTVIVKHCSDKWVSVIDLMPIMYDPVLTMFYGGGSMSAITIRALCSDGWMNEGGILCPKKNVTHWMPLPKPPKESE